MNALTPAAAPASRHTTSDRESIRDKNLALEELLRALSKFGKPRVSLLGGGWHCCVDMHVSSTGVSFEVKSDFNLPNPSRAAQQCCQRLDLALRDLGL